MAAASRFFKASRAKGRRSLVTATELPIPDAGRAFSFTRHRTIIGEDCSSDREDSTGRPMNESAKLKDSHLRSIAKAVTYRIVGTLTTALLAYLVTGSFKVAVTIAAFEPMIKTVVYYLHERAWQHVPRHPP